MRINKYLARVGYCSRRKADELVSAGKISVNNKMAVLGQNVSEDDKIKINNKLLKIVRSEPIIYALNKPKRIVSTVKDEKNRPSVTDLIKINQRFYPIGRLDKNSTGLILLTNNGDLAYKLTHPKFEVEKEYEVKLNNSIKNDKIEKLTSGISFRGTEYQADQVTRIGHNKYSIVLHEGKNREIRKMMQAIGREVLELKRIRLGNLKLGDLKEGEYKQLDEIDVNKLMEGR